MIQFKVETTEHNLRVLHDYIKLNNNIFFKRYSSFKKTFDAAIAPMYPLLHPTTLESIETSNIKRKLDLQLTIGDASIKGDPFDMFAKIHFKSTFYSYKSLILKYI